MVLHQTHKEAEDKWRKLSRQIVDQLLPLLDTQQVGAYVCYNTCRLQCVARNMCNFVRCDVHSDLCCGECEGQSGQPEVSGCGSSVV